MKRLAVGLVALALLAGCGGGGGGGGGEGGGGWLSFAPGSLGTTVYEGEGQWLEVTGTVTQVPSTRVNVGVYVDGTIMDDARLSAVDDGTYQLRVRVKAGLPLGTHRGNIEVRTCEDDPATCGKPYGGAPFHVPVTIVVQAAPGYPTSPANGDFSAGTSGWTVFRSGTASASLSADGGALHVALADGGPDYWSVQVYDTPGISLEAGKRYRLDFDAWADAAREIRVSVQENGRDLDGDGSPYDTYLADLLAPIALTPSVRHFRYTWTQPVTNRAADVDFFLGGSRVGVHLGAVTVSEGP